MITKKVKLLCFDLVCQQQTMSLYEWLMILKS